MFKIFQKRKIFNKAGVNPLTVFITLSSSKKYRLHFFLKIATDFTGLLKNINAGL